MFRLKTVDAEAGEQVGGNDDVDACRGEGWKKSGVRGTETAQVKCRQQSRVSLFDAQGMFKNVLTTVRAMSLSINPVKVLA